MLWKEWDGVGTIGGNWSKKKLTSLKKKIFPCSQPSLAGEGAAFRVYWIIHIYVFGLGSQECTVGEEGVIVDHSYIFFCIFGLCGPALLPSKLYTHQIWISGSILPHFDVRTNLEIESYKYFLDKKYFFLWPHEHDPTTTVECPISVLARYLHPMDGLCPLLCLCILISDTRQTRGQNTPAWVVTQMNGNCLQSFM